jgi:hypothetical protein
MKALKTLIKAYGFTTDSEYFEYCINSYLNGNKQQAKELFKQMKLEDKRSFLLSFTEFYDNPSQQESYNFFINLI